MGKYSWKRLTQKARSSKAWAFYKMHIFDRSKTFVKESCVGRPSILSYACLKFGLFHLFPRYQATYFWLSCFSMLCRASLRLNQRMFQLKLQTLTFIHYPNTIFQWFRISLTPALELETAHALFPSLQMQKTHHHHHHHYKRFVVKYQFIGTMVPGGVVAWCTMLSSPSWHKLHKLGWL